MGRKALQPSDIKVDREFSGRESDTDKILRQVIGIVLGRNRDQRLGNGENRKERLQLK